MHVVMSAAAPYYYPNHGHQPPAAATRLCHHAHDTAYKLKASILVTCYGCWLVVAITRARVKKGVETMQRTIDKAWSWCTTSDFHGLRRTWRAAYKAHGEGRWCTPQGWEEEECKAGCHANGWYGFMSPRWLDDWVGVSGGGVKEFYRRVKMLP